jgi:acetoin utilization deacetylase AcuC-like enzyme
MRGVAAGVCRMLAPALVRGLASSAVSLPMVYHARYSFEPWPEKHRFRMSKFRDLHTHLLAEGIATPAQLHAPYEDPPDHWFTAVHDADYYYGFCDGMLDAAKMRRIGFEWTPSLVARTRLECAGTVLAAQLALRHGMACHLGGGTHHAHRDFGSGFTILNDLAVAARYAQTAGLAKRVLIVDLDVHQGDGTAAIFADDPSVYTLSFHCGKNFPFRKSVSDLDIDLPPGTDDAAYLAKLADVLPRVLVAAQPDLVLFDAGVDVAAVDSLGYLQLSDQGIFDRDRFVLDACARAGLPVVTVIGGGYCTDLAELARRHAIVFRAAQSVWAEYALGGPPGPRL